MDTLAPGDIRQKLEDINEALEKVAGLAASNQDHTSKAIASVLCGIQAAINGGGLEDWVYFNAQFLAKMRPIWEEKITPLNN